jgi:hypothetical protein
MPIISALVRSKEPAPTATSEKPGGKIIGGRELRGKEEVPSQFLSCSKKCKSIVFVRGEFHPWSVTRRFPSASNGRLPTSTVPWIVTSPGFIVGCAASPVRDTASTAHTRTTAQMIAFLMGYLLRVLMGEALWELYHSRAGNGKGNGGRAKGKTNATPGII